MSKEGATVHPKKPLTTSKVATSSHHSVNAKSVLPITNTVVNRMQPVTIPKVENSKVSFGVNEGEWKEVNDDDHNNGKNKETNTTSPQKGWNWNLWWKLFLTAVITTTLILVSILFHDFVTSSSTGSIGGPCVPKCSLSSDITPVQFLTGVTNITYVCYRSSSQVIYTPPTDPLNYDFSTSSFNAARTVCQKSIKQTFTVQPAIIPYMANDPTGQANGVYTRCSLVWECSFLYFT